MPVALADITRPILLSRGGKQFELLSELISKRTRCNGLILLFPLCDLVSRLPPLLLWQLSSLRAESLERKIQLWNFFCALGELTACLVSQRRLPVLTLSFYVQKGINYFFVDDYLNLNSLPQRVFRNDIKLVSCWPRSSVWYTWIKDSHWLLSQVTSCGRSYVSIKLWKERISWICFFFSDSKVSRNIRVAN